MKTTLYQNISSESVHFWVAKFSIYLNRRVFVMKYHIRAVYFAIVFSSSFLLSVLREDCAL